MDDLLHSSRLIQDMKQKINRCRIYLRATTLADLVNAQGTHILSDAYLCHPHGQLPTTTLWPYQTRPGIKHRLVWQMYLDKWCDPHSRKLHQPLSTWLIDNHMNRWQAYYDNNLQVVLITENNVWNHYQPITKQRHQWIISKYDTIVNNTNPNQLPHIQPLDIILENENYYHCLLYTSPSPRDGATSRMPSSA